MPNAYVYKRFSDKEQEKGDSLRRQTDLADAFAARHGLTIVGEYVDRGVSSFRGKNAKKGELFRFFQDVEVGRISRNSWLLIEDFDRLDRRQLSKALPQFITLVEDRGIIVATTKDGGIYSKQNINHLSIALTYVMKSILAHAESVKKSERLTEVWEDRRAKRNFKSAVCPRWLSLDGGSYGAVPKTWATLHKMFDLAESGLGSPTIARILNNDPATPPFPTKHGKPPRQWHPTTIDNILTGREVLGVYQPCKMVDGERVPVGDPIPDHFPAVISEAQWLRVQALRKTKSRGKRDDVFSNLFQGIVFCDQCDGPMRVKTSFKSKKRPSGRDYRYFVCSDALLNRRCEAHLHFPLEAVENAILDNCHEYELHELFASPKRVEELAQIDEDIAALQAKIKEMERFKKNTSAQIAKLDDPNDPVGPELRENVRSYLAEIAGFEKDLKALEGRRITLTSLIDQRVDAEANVKALRAEIATAEGDALLMLRAKLSHAVKDFITHIRFFWRSGMFTVNLDGDGIMRSHQFAMVNGKGRSAGRKIEYCGAINFNNDEMREFLFGPLPVKDVGGKTEDDPEPRHKRRLSLPGLHHRPPPTGTEVF
jgi:DNA invertase Pin-like site-specific DNA recombinase